MSFLFTSTLFVQSYIHLDEIDKFLSKSNRYKSGIWFVSGLRLEENKCIKYRKGANLLFSNEEEGVILFESCFDKIVNDLLFMHENYQNSYIFFLNKELHLSRSDLSGMLAGNFFECMISNVNKMKWDENSKFVNIDVFNELRAEMSLILLTDSNEVHVSVLEKFEK